MSNRWPESVEDRLEDRLLANIQVDEGGCWLWQGQINRPSGYAVISVRNYPRYAHRIAAQVWLGHSYGAEGLVLHHCDVRHCINPDHLYIGTQKQNMKDCVDRKRIARGERNGFAKLTEGQVREIRERYGQGSTQMELARLFGLGQSHVSRLIRREAWV